MLKVEPSETKNIMSKNKRNNEHTRLPSGARRGESCVRETGVIATTGKGLGFVPLEGYEEDAMIQQGQLNCALNGDLVEVRLQPRAGKRVEGIVDKIITRKKTMFVGTVVRVGDKNSDKPLYDLIPDDTKCYVHFAITNLDFPDLTHETKAQIEMEPWTDPHVQPRGKITEVFGSAGTHRAEMGAIIAGAGFDQSFPKDVDAAAEKLSENYAQDLENERKNRRDFRNVLTFTIDPYDAKDFDDAISYQKLPNGQHEVGIHIADVSHFVREGTVLDDEAYRRATSVYLVDRTIPMLPEALSNEICSLKPNVPRLTFSAVFNLDDNATVLNAWFGRTIINSHHRFTYESAQEVLDHPGKDEKFGQVLNKLNKFAKTLHEKRMKRGAISFENDREVKFELDAEGKPIGLIRKERTDSHKLVEEFMLLANRRVAEYASSFGQNSEVRPPNPGIGGRTSEFPRPVVFVYRNHDIPNVDKVMILKEFLGSLGHKLHIKGKKLRAEELNDVLHSAEGDPALAALIEKSILRSMAKAVYSTKNIGHYGLAFDHYTHFTSPIRRYPDLMVHRLLFEYLSGRTPERSELKVYEERCLHASVREREAMHAEWDSIKYKQSEYLATHIGDTYEAVITSVADWGMYVETIEELCEGLVSVRDMSDDFYEHHEKAYALVGQKKKKRYRVGDTLKVKVKSTDIAKKQVNFTAA